MRSLQPCSSDTKSTAKTWLETRPESILWESKLSAVYRGSVSGTLPFKAGSGSLLLHVVTDCKYGIVQLLLPFIWLPGGNLGTQPCLAAWEQQLIQIKKRARAVRGILLSTQPWGFHVIHPKTQRKNAKDRSKKIKQNCLYRCFFIYAAVTRLKSHFLQLMQLKRWFQRPGCLRGDAYSQKHSLLTQNITNMLTFMETDRLHKSISLWRDFMALFLFGLKNMCTHTHTHAKYTVAL